MATCLLGSRNSFVNQVKAESPNLEFISLSICIDVQMLLKGFTNYCKISLEFSLSWENFAIPSTTTYVLKFKWEVLWVNETLQGLKLHFWDSLSFWFYSSFTSVNKHFLRSFHIFFSVTQISLSGFRPLVFLTVLWKCNSAGTTVDSWRLPQNKNIPVSSDPAD